MSSTNLTAAALADRASESRAPQALVVITLCPAIALVVLLLRLYTRNFLLKRVFWEDYIISVAMVFSIVMSGFMVVAFTNGSGRHIETITKDEMILQSRISPGVHVPYIVTHMFIKLSILLHYTRISVMAFERRLCYVLMGILVSGYFVVIVLSLVRCIPFEALWVPNIPGAKCLDTTKLFLAVQSHTLAMDFIILLAPLFILRHLTVPWLQRVVLVIVVGFGGMACIAAVIRLQVLRLSTTSPDRTWDSYLSAIYGAIECNLGIVCACIVTLRPMFRRWRWFSGGGEPETSKVEMESPRVRRNDPDEDLMETNVSTIVLGTSSDVEHGMGNNGDIARLDYESKRGIILVTSLAVDKDDSCAGSTVAGSGLSQGLRDLDTKASFPK